MRQFQLINETGAVFDLSPKQNPFLYTPKGLGFSISTSFGNSSDGFFGSTKRTGQQGSVSGTLVFTKNPYSRFREFVSFVQSAKELKFGYKPLNTWYYFTAIVSKCDKSELTEVGVLECAVEFKMVSPWAKENPMRKTITPIATSLTYPMVYPFTYGGDIAGTLEFNISGDLDGAIELSIQGALQNPVISIDSFDGAYTNIGSIELDCEISANETLQISTRPDNTYIRKVDDNGAVTDLTGFVNIEKNVFGRPSIGKNRLSITSDTIISTVADVRVYDYYRAV